MIDALRATRITALAERSSYVENVLRHSLISGLSGVLWKRDPRSSLQVFNSEVDDSGFDVVLRVGAQQRYVQLKQAHDEKLPSHVSVQAPFALIAGACVILMSHSMIDLSLTSFRFYGGKSPSDAMPNIDNCVVSKAPGRRTVDGTRKLRENYRNVRVRDFGAPLSLDQLFDALFPVANEGA